MAKVLRLKRATSGKLIAVVDFGGGDVRAYVLEVSDGGVLGLGASLMRCDISSGNHGRCKNHGEENLAPERPRPPGRRTRLHGGPQAADR